ncbi:MAG: hypothetical protein IJI25_07960 [Eubacterium sp.]|nr:hypothetical protein [Eubacterium sp.]
MRKTGLSRYITRLTAFLLSGSMIISNVVPVAAASKKKDNKDKVETVYVNANAEGDTDKITVSEQLKSHGEGSIEDYSTLKNIKNVKGDEEFTRNADCSITWSGTGEDIFYQGESDAALPVSVKVTYFLDGKKISPEKLAGKSGKVKIRFDYTNNTSNTVKVNKKDVSVQTPFTIVSAMILPSENFSNVEVENGRVVNDGDRNIVIGMAMPGLRKSLKLDDYEKLSDVDIPDHVEVTADATDFELSMTATMATTGTINEFDLDGLDDLDDLKKDMDKLTDASSELIEGSGKLLDGLNTLDSSMKTYTKGVSKADEGAGQLRDGLKKVAGKKAEFEKGAEDLTKGLSTLKNGTKTLKKGVNDYTSGASTLEKGIENAASGSSALKSGAGSLSKGLKDYTDGAEQIQQGVHKINSEVSSIKIPQDASEAAKKLAADAKQLKAKEAEINAMMKKLSTLEKDLNDYKTDVQSWMGKVVEKANATDEKAKTETKSKLQDMASSANSKALEKVNDKAEKGRDASKKSHDNAASAAASAVNEAKSQIDGMNLTDEQKSAIKNKLDSISNSVSNANVASVENETSVDLGLSTEVSDMNISGELKSELGKFPTMELDVKDADTGQIIAIIEDMKSQAKVLEKYGSTVEGLKEKIPELREGLNKIDKGASRLAENSDKLIKGMKQLSSGIDSLNSGLNALEDGAKKLTANNNSLTGGTSSLDDGAGKLLSGSKKLELAVKKVTKAADLLATGSVQLKNGTGKLDSAGDQINSGVGKLVGGMQTLNDGFVKFDEEGIKKLADLAGDDLDSMTTQLKAIKEADKSYQSYGGIKEGSKGSVKFIIETAAIEKDDE